MSPRLRRFTARELIAALRLFESEVVAMRGSHAKLRRVSPDGKRQTLTVPLHGPLAFGTVRAIYRQVCAHVPEAEARRVFRGD